MQGALRRLRQPFRLVEDRHHRRVARIEAAAGERQKTARGEAAQDRAAADVETGGSSALPPEYGSGR